MRKVIFAAALTCLASTASANHASFFSHGPTMPFTVVQFDSSGKPSSALFPAGLGYTLNFNFLESADGRVRWFTLGYPVFLNAADENFQARLGLTVGTYNNLLAVGAAFDLVDTKRDTGAFMGDFGWENVRFLFSLNFNLGSGMAEPPPAMASKNSNEVTAVHEAHAGFAPPCYLRFK